MRSELAAPAARLLVRRDCSARGEASPKRKQQHHPASSTRTPDPGALAHFTATNKPDEALRYRSYDGTVRYVLFVMVSRGTRMESSKLAFPGAGAGRRGSARKSVGIIDARENHIDIGTWKVIFANSQIVDKMTL